MRIVVFGAGGAGGYFGGRLAQAGEDVVFIARGELDNRPSERAGRLRDALSDAGIATTIAEDIHVALWEKFLFIVPFGGVGAVTRAPIGTIRSIPETRRMLEQGMREIFQVARAKDVPLADDAIARTMDFVYGQLPAGISSMQRDIVAGRPLELEEWNGAVVRLEGKWPWRPRFTPFSTTACCLWSLRRAAKSNFRPDLHTRRASTIRWSLPEVKGSPSNPPYSASTSKSASRSINTSSSRFVARMVRSCARLLCSSPDKSYSS